jgi:hypothetical protein
MPLDAEPFFETVDATAGRYRASELTRGPWDGAHQHAGPPGALIGRAIELCEGIGESPTDRNVARITFEILRPIPIGELIVEAEVVRPGRRVEMVEARLLDPEADELELVRARGWRIAADDVDLPPELLSAEPGSAPARAGRPSGLQGPPSAPDEFPRGTEFFPSVHDRGYHTAMEYRWAHGSFAEAGPAVCWMRMLHPLVDDEEPSPLSRVLIAADSGNGISSTLDIRRYLFINVDLTVHLHRLPAGEWVCLDGLTAPEPTGVGMSDTMLFDERGPIGRACQTLLVAER